VQHSTDLTRWTEIDRVRSKGAEARSDDRHPARIAAAAGFYRVQVLP
jgi:hypothetical protein